MKLKHTGEFPIVGVNTFLSSKGPTVIPAEVIHCYWRRTIPDWYVGCNLHQSNQDKVNAQLNSIQEAIKNENLFEHLMEANKGFIFGTNYGSFIWSGVLLQTKYVSKKFSSNKSDSHWLKYWMYENIISKGPSSLKGLCFWEIKLLQMNGMCHF
jgi:hypothetical protein